MTEEQRAAHERMSGRLPKRSVVDAEGWDTEAYVESVEVRSWAAANRTLSREEERVRERLRKAGQAVKLDASNLGQIIGRLMYRTSSRCRRRARHR
jgi:hypothetical protein